jgi:hypothetical protein
MTTVRVIDYDTFAIARTANLRASVASTPMTTSSLCRYLLA